MAYKIHKILNNNAVLSEDENCNEIIITGNGVGFNVHVGGTVYERKISKIYVPQTKAFVNRFSSLMNEIPIECFEEAEEIKEMAESELHQSLNENLIIALADHITFAISQYQEGSHRTVLMNEELERFYPDEYRVGKKAVQMVEKKFGVKCSRAEAGAFTFHIVNAEMSGRSDDATRIMQSIQDILEIVKKTMNMEI
ncbi:MAG: CAT RNA binding domain-containing protein, partial [Bulleidia sp.]